MNHRSVGRKFNRVRRVRKALLKTLLGSLIVKEKIKTTEAKAKELKRLIDPLIGKAKRLRADESKKLALLRDLESTLPKIAVKKLSGDFSDRFSDRSSGYTRVVKLEARKSDAAKMAIIEFV